MKTRGQIWRNLFKNWISRIFEETVILVITCIGLLVLFAIGYFGSMLFIKDSISNILSGVLVWVLLGIIFWVYNIVSRIKDAYYEEKFR